MAEIPPRAVSLARSVWAPAAAAREWVWLVRGENASLTRFEAEEEFAMHNKSPALCSLSLGWIGSWPHCYNIKVLSSQARERLAGSEEQFDKPGKLEKEKDWRWIHPAYVLQLSFYGNVFKEKRRVRIMEYGITDYVAEYNRDKG